MESESGRGGKIAVDFMDCSPRLLIIVVMDTIIKMEVQFAQATHIHT
jgi:hypothetical protein